MDEAKADSKLQSPDHFTNADENGMGSHGERIGDSGRREPWALQPVSQAHASRENHGQRGYQISYFHEISNLWAFLFSIKWTLFDLFGFG